MKKILILIMLLLLDAISIFSLVGFSLFLNEILEATRWAQNLFYINYNWRLAIPVAGVVLSSVAICIVTSMLIWMLYSYISQKRAKKQNKSLKFNNK